MVAWHLHYPPPDVLAGSADDQPQPQNGFQQPNGHWHALAGGYGAPGGQPASQVAAESAPGADAQQAQHAGQANGYDAQLQAGHQVRDAAGGGALC